LCPFRFTFLQIPPRLPWVNGCFMIYASPGKTPCHVPPVIGWHKEETMDCRKP